MKYLGIMVAMAAVIIAPEVALAQFTGGTGVTQGIKVPEIDAVAGVAALAVVGAAVALIRERTKR